MKIEIAAQICNFFLGLAAQIQKRFTSFWFIMT